MNKAVKRMWMSLFLVVITMFTAIATTFAWVGIASNNTFDKFTINLRDNGDNSSEYGIQLSLTGKEGSFNDTIQQEELEKQILLNMGYTEQYLKQYGVSNTFRLIKLTQCTVARASIANPSTNVRLTDFYDMNGYSLTKKYNNNLERLEQATGFVFFDLYVSVYNKTAADVTTSAPNIYLKNFLLSSELCSTNILNPIKIDAFDDEIYGNVTINAANACRVGIQRFDIVKKYDVSAYDKSTQRYPNMLTIFQNGELTPSRASDGTYDFGGVLPRSNNLAYKYYQSVHQSNLDGVSDSLDLDSRICTRGDKVFVDDDTTNLILPSSQGFTSNDMVKYRFYFWVEGWDGDCFEAINRIPINLNLEFSTKTPAQEGE